MSAGYSKETKDGAGVKPGCNGSTAVNGKVNRQEGAGVGVPTNKLGPDRLHDVIISTNVKNNKGGAHGEVNTKIYSPAEIQGGQEGKGGRLNLILKFIAIVTLLYFFVCSLDILSNSFRLIAGRAAGEVFQQEKLLNNPIVGVMIGILVTVAVQSSSTSTSIVVSMVSSGLFTVKTAIPIVMGANIGTSVTNTIVALTHMSSREEFERAFAGSVLHDMFNLLAVATLLIVEQFTSYLEVTTTAIMNSMDLTSTKGADIQVLSRITKPLTSLIVQLDKNVIIGWSMGESKYENASLLKKLCNKPHSVDVDMNSTEIEEVGERCYFLFNAFNISDLTAGVILLVASLSLLCGCLVCLVKVLSTLLKGKLAVAVQKGVNANVPYCPFLTGYLALGIGALMTVLVQSSSVFTSAMTPLIALGMISLERAYPLTLGSNLGTTTTAMLAALAAEGPNLRWSIQLAMCHFLFNMTGILIFYPIPFMRFPIRMAAALGRVTAKYRWFAIFYLVFMFVILPLLVFCLSLIGAIAFYCVSSVVGVIFCVTTVVSLLQEYSPERLPTAYRTWNFLPLYLHSLEPYDKFVQKALDLARQTCCTVCCASASQDSNEIIKMKPSHSSSGGLDNLGFVRGDQIDELKKAITLAQNNTTAISLDEDMEQTQL